MDANREAQMEELTALASIYPDYFSAPEEHQEELISYILTIPATPRKDLSLIIHYPTTYPSEDPPFYELSTEWYERGGIPIPLEHSTSESIRVEFDRIWQEQKGDVVVFSWVEWLVSFLKEKYDGIDTNVDEDEQVAQNDQNVSSDFIINDTTVAESTTVNSETPLEIPLYHSEPVTINKSTFLAHVARVSSLEEIKQVKEFLYRNPRIARATHNVTAYRFSSSSGNMVQDCDDDGESAAGGRMLHLLQLLNIDGYYVMVTRWYGGVKLGPDRFRIINNVARSGLEVAGAIPRTETTSTKKGTKAKR